MKEQMTLYQKAHLIAAVVRLHTHREGVPPTPEQIAEELDSNIEMIHHVLNKMEELGAAQIASGSFGVRVMLADHLKIEELEGADETPDITDEVEAFKKAQAEKAEKLSKMFAKDYKDEEKETMKKDLAEKIADPSKLKRDDNPLNSLFKKKS